MSCSDVPTPQIYDTDRGSGLSQNPTVNYTTFLTYGLDKSHFPITIEVINSQAEVIISDSIFHDFGDYTINLTEEKEGKLYVVAESQLETFTYQLIKLAK
jgi:hypothetical protein